MNPSEFKNHCATIMPHTSSWDVLIVGGGHAGVEAALVAARLSCKTLLITSRVASLAMMPCNPSIGGLAKSHLVYELDALGGEMPLCADRSGLQYKTLNASRGPAVRATRIQCDKAAYAARMQEVLAQTSGLTILEDEVIDLICEKYVVSGAVTATHGVVNAKTVVLTTGTALGGSIHIGKESESGGGDGRPATDRLSQALRRLGFTLIRLKTGTPPRLLAESIDWGEMARQPGEIPPPLFSLRAQMFHVEQMKDPCSTWNHAINHQVDCWLTHTTQQTHTIIRENLSRSALHGGSIEGTGVRYCPSIEDKIVKFTQAQHHHVFLEPEGRATNWIYPNGLSNSLPRDVQRDMVHSVPGLSRAEFVADGYAIEYDSIDSRELRHTLESQRLKGLYFAGQVNGTTGYEEAAAQGFMAGANAALCVRKEAPLVLSRQDAYIGVMIDDLVTKGTNEPYRMFTSRAERRLILRQDNARYRLLEVAERLGVALGSDLAQTRAYAKEVQTEIDRLTATRQQGVPLLTLLARPDGRYAELPRANLDLPLAVSSQVEILAKYQGYIAQEERAAQRAKQEELLVIPAWLDYERISALRYESREKLMLVRPENLGQAARIPGVNPADIAVLSLIIKRGKI